MKHIGLILLSFSLCLFSFCDSSEDDDNSTGSGTSSDEEYQDIEVSEDGTVRFYVSEDSDAARATMGVDSHTWSASTVTVNGKDYTIKKDTDSRWYVDVTASTSSTYNAVLTTENSTNWYSESKYSPVLPYSQFWDGTAADLLDFPMYASYSTETGNKLIFNDGFAVLDVSLDGEASIASIKAEHPDGDPVAGDMVYSPSVASFSAGSGNDFVVLNTTAEGDFVELNSSKTHFYLVLAPGSYEEGLDLTISDSDHRARMYSTGSLTLSAGYVTTVEISYAPEDDVVFYETFDNLVWGGDIVGKVAGYAPDSDDPTSATSRTGYENALTEVDYSTAGSPIIQSDWDSVSGFTVGTASHPVTNSYIYSRNFYDYQYLFRCLEYQGYLAIGTSTTQRGYFTTPVMKGLPLDSSVELSFDVCAQSGMDDDFLLIIAGTGLISGIYYDNTELSLTDGSYTEAAMGYCQYQIDNSIFAEDAGSEWHKITVYVDHASSGTSFRMMGSTTSSGTHGFYMDNILVKVLDSATIEPQDLRVMVWNIQCGMWGDQANNYDNFVAWVSEYDPDVCIWCEAATVYNDNSVTAATDKFLPDGWASLAARYGHSYVATSGYRDSGPQEITSKYPITTLLKITDTDVSGQPVAHGAGMYKITIGSSDVYFISAHLWPWAYTYDATDETSSATAREGDDYRLFEITYILGQTVLSDTYSSVDNWLMMGDFNSYSIKDNNVYGYSEDNSRFKTHNYILNNTDLVDIIAETYPDYMVPSTYTKTRIDYMYASPAMWNGVVNAYTIVDEWSTIYNSPLSTERYLPSDHRAIMVDFKL